MRWSLALCILLATAATAWGHEWRSDSRIAPDWNGCTEAYLGCAGGELIGYGLADEWAEEVQVCFELPPAPKGGPWLIEYVAFFVSGQGQHRVTLREVENLYGAPGELIADDVTFMPIYAAWPPTGWTYVSVKETAGAGQLPAAEGECICVGFEMLPGDAIGLGTVGATTRGWSLSDGMWIDDSPLGVTAAVRIGLTDLGVSQSNMSTWGAIKDLFIR